MASALVAAASPPSPAAGSGSAGTVVAFGSNSKGELGDGTSIDRLSPTPTVGLDGVVAVAAAGAGNSAHSLALRDDGTVWAWGGNSDGVLGDGSTTDRSTPVQVVALRGVTAIAAGASHSLALLADGTVWSWGRNGCGELGRSGDPRTAAKVAGLQGVRAIAAGSAYLTGHSLAVTSDGKVYAWGYNGTGQLGNGTADVAGSLGPGNTAIFTCPRHEVPTAATFPPGAPKAVAVAAGSNTTNSNAVGGHSLALMEDHTVFAWGENVNGQLGIPNGPPSPFPVPVAGLAGKPVTAVAAGGTHSLALITDGTVYVWGGQGPGVPQAPSTAVPGTFVPAQVTGLDGVTQIAAGTAHNLAVRADASLWAWGTGNRGQAGPSPSTVPVQLRGLAGPVAAVAAGATHSLAVVVPGSPPPVTTPTTVPPVTLPPVTAPTTTPPTTAVTVPPSTLPPTTTTTTTTTVGPMPVVSPNPADFGDQVVGRVSSRPVTVTNAGVAPLAIATVAISGSDFSIAGDACSQKVLTTGQSCAISVGFLPAATGARQGSLIITHGAKDLQTVVGLAGYGTLLADAARSSLTAAPTTVAAGVASTLSAVLRDAAGAAVERKAVSFAKLSGPGAPSIACSPCVTDASGTVQASVQAGPAGTYAYAATDTTDGFTIAQTATVAVVAGPVSASASTVAARPTAVAPDGSPSTVSVTLVDAFANPVAAKTVSLTKSAGPVTPTITPAQGVTDAGGTVTFTVSSTAGVEGVDTFAATDVTDSVAITPTASVSFSKAAVSAIKSTLVASPTSVAADGTTASTLTVTVRNGNGAALASKSVTVTQATGPGSPSISPTTATTNATGVATFTVRSTTPGVDTFTATDTTDGETITQTAKVTFTGPVSASGSTMVARPTAVAPDGTPATVTVTLRDALASPVPAKTVSLTKSAGPVAPTISPAQGVTDAAGRVTFTVSSAAGLEGADTFAATDVTDNLTITPTAGVSFAKSAVSSIKSTVVASPTSVTADNTALSTLTVTLRNGNGAALANKSITVAKTAGPGTPTLSPASATTNASGVATFTVRSTTAGADSFTATDATDGETITQTATVTFTAGPVSASASTVAAKPTVVAPDGTPATVTVTLRDAYANPVAAKTVSVAKTAGPVAATIAPAQGVSDANGMVTFAVSSAAGVEGSDTFAATDVTDTLAITATATVSFAKSAPSSIKSTVVASPTTVAANGTAASTVTVTVRNGNGVALANKSLTLAKTAGPGIPTIVPATATTNTSGVATFTVRSATVGIDTFAATDITDGIRLNQTATVSFA